MLRCATVQTMSWQGYGSPEASGHPAHSDRPAADASAEPAPPPVPAVSAAPAPPSAPPPLSPSLSPPASGPPAPARTAGSAGGTGLVVLVVAVAAVAGMIFTGVGLWRTVAAGRSERAAAGATPSATPPSRSSAPAAPAVPATPAAQVPSHSPEAQVRPKVSGWLGVGSEKYRLAYDVPPAWGINGPGVVLGFEDRRGQVRTAMSATAEFRRGYCPRRPNAARAAAGFNGYVDAALGPVARHAARRWADAAFETEDGRPPTVSLSAPRTLRLGGMRAVRVTATATVHSDDACEPQRGVVHAVATPGRGESKTTVFVIWADQGTADAAAPATLRKMIRSLRPLR